MRSLIELLGRTLIVIINILLLAISKPYIGEAIPTLAPYSTHIVYTGTVILVLWLMVPLIDVLFGYSHKHDQIIAKSLQ